MADQAQIRELLGSGLRADVVASAVGVSSSYIAQLMGDAEFANSVIQLRTENLSAHTARDKKIDALEDTILEKVADVVASGMIYKPRDLIAAFSIINKASRRGAPVDTNAVSVQTIVNLTLPTQLIKGLTISTTGEVVDVQMEEGTQTLVTMPTSTLLQDLANRSESDAAKFRGVSNFLPGAAVAQSEAGRRGAEQFRKYHEQTRERNAEKRRQRESDQNTIIDQLSTGDGTTGTGEEE